jgi:predicted HTH transcriptional regulator
MLAAINEETSRLEFKRELDFGDVTKEIVALANSQGGIVVVGFEVRQAASR